MDERGNLPSASGGSKFYACAGSVALEATAPEQEPTDEGIQGAEIAEAREKESDEGLDEEGKTIADRLKAQEQKAVTDWMAERFPGEQARPVPMREFRCWIRDQQTMEPVASAKPDWFYIFKDEALVGDDKSGYLTVTDAHKNIQSRIQAVAIVHEFPHVKRVRVAMSQFRFKERFTACDYNNQALVQAEREILFRLWVTKDPHAHRTAGPHCRWCRARGYCPEAAAMSLLPVAALRGDLTTKEGVAMAVAQMSLEQRAYVRHQTALINSITAAVRTSLMGESDEALATVGLRKVPSDGVRSLPDVDALWKELWAQGVTPDEFRSILKASIGAAEEFMIARLRKADPDLKQKDAKTKVDAILAPAIKMVPREPSLKAI